MWPGTLRVYQGNIEKIGRTILKGKEIIPSRHLKKQMQEKGITVDQVIEAVSSPDKVTYVRTRPEFAKSGQRRFCGAGVAVVAEVREDEVILITVYLDGVCTPLREDQLDDPLAVKSRRAKRGRK